MNDLERKIYYLLLFKMLRLGGHLTAFARANNIHCKQSESTVDALVRLGCAPDPWAAVELIAGAVLPDPRPFAREIASLSHFPLSADQRPDGRKQSAPDGAGCTSCGAQDLTLNTTRR